MITDNDDKADDMIHLRRSIELATEALEAGDEPFGSVLVAGDGQVLHEDRNRANSVDALITLRLLLPNGQQSI